MYILKSCFMKKKKLYATVFWKMLNISLNAAITK